jgi:spermidine/putrescine transport system permease protein
MGNLIKEQFLENRDWPLGAALSLLLTLAVLAVAGLSSALTRNRGQL